MQREQKTLSWRSKNVPRLAMASAPGWWELLIILSIYALPLGILFGVFLIILFFIYRLFRRADSEKRRLRLEVGKIAHEMEAARKDPEA